MLFISFKKHLDLRNFIVLKVSSTKTLFWWVEHLGLFCLLLLSEIFFLFNFFLFFSFLFFQLLIPFLQVSLFCLCIGREPVNLKFGIVNNETIYDVPNPNASLIFVSELSDKTFDKVKMTFISILFNKTTY